MSYYNGNPAKDGEIAAAAEGVHFGKSGKHTPADHGAWAAKTETLAKARDQLNKETERGEHRPSVGGHSDHKHGGES